MKARAQLPIALAIALVSVLPACGDDGGDDTGGDILDELAALPGVEVTEVTVEDPEPGVRYFDLWFMQPVDHGAPGATFRQYAALIHVDRDAPMVVYTSGYGAGRLRTRGEVAALVGGNQLSLEYRYYRNSRPSPPDWSKLDVQQASADFHHVVELVKPLFPAAWVHTGGSKGGETVLHSRYLYPGDFDAGVAYVTPVRLGNPDLRYSGVLDGFGDTTCRDALRAAQRELLVRRAAMVARAEASDAEYAILGADFAVEISIVEVEWTFWQYRGETACGSIPTAPATATDDELWQFFEDTSSPSAYSDPALADSYHGFTYQVVTQLGYPIVDHAHIEDLTIYDYQDMSPFLPPEVDPAALSLDTTFSEDLVAWAATSADRLMIIDGEWDPWVAGAVMLSPEHDARRYVVPHGTHGSNIAALPPAEQQDALDRLARWTGVSVPAPPPQRLAPAPESPTGMRLGGALDPY